MTDEAAGSTLLHKLFWPQSIAIIGASASERSLAARPLHILQKSGYGGRVYPVNPRHREILETPCYDSVAALPEIPDLAVLVVNAETVPAAVEECAASGISNVVVISSGFAESHDGAQRLRNLHDILQRYPKVRLVGPNSEGFVNTFGKVPITFSPAAEDGQDNDGPPEGPVAIVAQSGGLGFAVFADGRARGLGFGYAISTGNEDGLTALDYVDYLVTEPRIGVITVFLEGLADGSRLRQVAAAAATTQKPIVVAKAGASSAGQRAAESHTARLTGNDDVYRAVFRRCGITVVEDQEELIDTAMAFAWGTRPAGNRVAVLTYSGGTGAWTADALVAAGFEVPALSLDLRQRIQSLMPAYGSSANPVDVTAQAAHSGTLMPILELIADSGEVDTVVVVTPLSNTGLLRRDWYTYHKRIRGIGIPVLVHGYTRPTQEAIDLLARLRIPWSTSCQRAARALRSLRDYELFLESADDGAVVGVATVPHPPVGAPGQWPEWEAKAILRKQGIPVPEGRFVPTAHGISALRDAAEQIGFPVVLKVQSRTLVHKTDVGAMALALQDVDAVADAAQRIAATLPETAPDLRVDGWLIERMHTVHAEMIVGAVRDPALGPALVIGFGGIYTEILADTVCLPLPLSAPDVAEGLRRLRGAALLDGARGGPAADVDALIDVVVRIADFVAAHPEIEGLDLNPVSVGAQGQGAIVLDASGTIAATG
ncbi:acetate--CoA ligase family protein [Nocardia sp. CA-084685]|uniref:acetate--CoA ligase family protein n=1 Tax=Nocardia sp. CA-084685 TaxID=3239970 RepID=UPI003D95C1D4